MRASIAVLGLFACATAGRVDDDAGVTANRCGIDILFVISNSRTMAEEQADLAANIPAFMLELDSSDLAYRVGVLTTGRDFSFDITGPFGISHYVQTGE